MVSTNDRILLTEESLGARTQRQTGDAGAGRRRKRARFRSCGRELRGAPGRGDEELPRCRAGRAHSVAGAGARCAAQVHGRMVRRSKRRRRDGSGAGEPHRCSLHAVLARALLVARVRTRILSLRIPDKSRDVGWCRADIEDKNAIMYMSCIPAPSSIDAEWPVGESSVDEQTLDNSVSCLKSCAVGK
jgi:hypothetical protein